MESESINHNIKLHKGDIVKVGINEYMIYCGIENDKPSSTTFEPKLFLTSETVNISMTLILFSKYKI